MSTINIEVTKNVYDVDLQQNVTSYDVTLEKGYYPLPGGGGGGGDTSNLVPYTGATKNVNIGAFYFESAAGFKKTGGTSNQYLMADGSTSTLPTDLAFKSDIDNLQIGGRNLALNSKGFLDQNSDWVRNFNLSENLIVGQQYTVTVWVRAIQGINDYFGINDVNGNNSFPIVKKSDNVFSYTFIATHVTNELVLTRQPNGTSSYYQFESFKIERGNKATDWTPAPEDKQDRLQDVIGNIGVGKTDASATEKLDVNGNVKANGFKTPNGSATQGLTANGGVFDLNTKADLAGGKVPASQLPAYVDDVLEFANLASFPATGESGKIYIAIDTNLTYRWGGSSYVVMSSSLALGETSSTAYRGDNGKIAYDHSQVTHDKNLVGLGNVDNTSDLNKPISTATQNALNTKANIVDIPSKTSFTHDILVSNWTLVSGKYEAVISNAGILANSFVDVIPSNDNVDIVRNAQIYPSVLISAGSVKVYSKFLPSGTISVTVNVN